MEKTTTESTRLIGEYIPGDWSEETLETEGIVKREPYGLIITISPFNYPLFIPATKIIPAMLVGNAVILKPASTDPLVPLMFTRVLEMASFPKHSFTTIPMSGKDSNILVKSKKINAISFTGSTRVGEQIIKEAGIKAFHMELDGKSPAIVLEDTDLNDTIDKLVKGIISFSGQRCDAIRLILVEYGIFDQLKRSLVEELTKYEPKNPLEFRSCFMGPLIDEQSTIIIEEMYTDAIKKNAVPLLEFKRNKNYVWPILLEIRKDILPELDLFQKDVFGPVTLLIEVENENEAIKIANSSKFGLDTSIFGTDDSRIRKIA